MENQNKKSYYELNKDSVLGQQKEYRDLNPEKRKELNKKSYEENKQIYAENSKIKRELAKEINSKLSKEEIYSKTPIKFCGQCKIEHNSLDFYIDKTKNDGLERICKIAKKSNKGKNK